MDVGAGEISLRPAVSRYGRDRRRAAISLRPRRPPLGYFSVGRRGRLRVAHRAQTVGADHAATLGRGRQRASRAKRAVGRARRSSRPYRGYLHLLPRVIAWIASHTADVVHWPAIYNGAALFVATALFARMASPRLHLPGKPWLVLAFVLAANTGEVFLNITNLHWLTAFFLLQQVLIARPTAAHATRRRSRPPARRRAHRPVRAGFFPVVRVALVARAVSPMAISRCCSPPRHARRHPKAFIMTTGPTFRIALAPTQSHHAPRRRRQPPRRVAAVRHVRRECAAAVRARRNW